MTRTRESGSHIIDAAIYSMRTIGNPNLTNVTEVIVDEEIEEGIAQGARRDKRILLLYKTQRKAREGFRGMDQVEEGFIMAESRSDLIRKTRDDCDEVRIYEYRSEEGHERLGGCEWDEVRIMQESGPISQQIIDQVVRPGTRTRGAEILYIGTPPREDTFFDRHIGRPLFDRFNDDRSAGPADLTIGTMLAARDRMLENDNAYRNRPMLHHITEPHFESYVAGRAEERFNERLRESTHLPITRQDFRGASTMHAMNVDHLYVGSSIRYDIDERTDRHREKILRASVEIAGKLSEGIENHIVKEASTEVLERLRLKIKNEMRRRDRDEDPR